MNRKKGGAMISAKENGIAFICGRPSPRAQDPTLILLHGSGLAGAFWHHQVDALADHMNTMAIDLPGHGQSDAPALESVPAYAAAVMQFLGACGLPRPIPCGLSLGGAIALQMLLDYPEALAGAVLIGTGARLRVRPEIFDRITRDYPGLRGGHRRHGRLPADTGQRPDPRPRPYGRLPTGRHPGRLPGLRPLRCHGPTGGNPPSRAGGLWGR